MMCSSRRARFAATIVVLNGPPAVGVPGPAVGVPGPCRIDGWPHREGAAYYADLMADPACLLALARDGDRFYARHGFEPQGVTLRTAL